MNDTPPTVSPVRPATFFTLAFAPSWLIWIPLTLSHFGIGPLHIPEGISSSVRLLGVLMPAVAALLLTARAGGRSAVRSLLERLTLWRVGWRWWLAAVVVVPALLMVSGLFYNWLWGNPPVMPQPAVAPVALIVNVIFLALATLGEEIGWRGVALPALQQRYSPLASSAILGLLWGIWHVPFWLLIDTLAQFGIGYFALNFALALPMTAYITWFFNHSRGSLLLPVAFHLAFNLVNVVWLPVTSNTSAFGLFIAALWLIALLILPRLEPKRHASSA
jgi:membrane protease YdiL (CAAX protease family)